MSAVAAVADPPWFHLLPGAEPAVFLTGGSMLFDIDQDLLGALGRGQPEALAELRALAAPPPDPPQTLPPVAALSLNVAQSCNLACTYCYADEGRFGGRPRMMESAVAFAAIDRLMAQARRRVTVGFIGGEPFLNRRLINDAVAYAKASAARAGLGVGFSVTTNATLLTDDDLRLLRDEAFTVTVSLDGGPAQNRHRPKSAAIGLDRGGSGGHRGVAGAARPCPDFGTGEPHARRPRRCRPSGLAGGIGIRSDWCQSGAHWAERCAAVEGGGLAAVAEQND